MLRESAGAFGYDLDLSVIRDPSLPVAIPGGTQLLALVDIVLDVSSDSLTSVHAAIIDVLGPASLVDAAAVFGNFQMMNRVAEGTGIPISQQAIEREGEMVAELGLLNLLKR